MFDGGIYEPLSQTGVQRVDVVYAEPLRAPGQLRELVDPRRTAFDRGRADVLPPSAWKTLSDICRPSARASVSATSGPCIGNRMALLPSAPARAASHYRGARVASASGSKQIKKNCTPNPHTDLAAAREHGQWVHAEPDPPPDVDASDRARHAPRAPAVAMVEIRQ